MKRLIIAGLAGSAALLTAGGVAYAVGTGTDPSSPETGYVEVVDPSPSPSSGGDGRDRDCPEKNGPSPNESAPNESDQSGTL